MTSERRFVSQRRNRLFRPLAGRCLCLCLWLLVATASSAATPGASPSQPPFWARPQPSGANCACDPPAETAVAPAASSGAGTAVMLAATGIGLSLLVLLWLRTSRSRSPETTRSPARARTLIARASIRPHGDRRAQRDRRKTALRAAPPGTARVAAAPSPAELLTLFGAPGQIELAESPQPDSTGDSRGFYAEVAASLSAAIEKEPARQDLRRKLLEVYGAAGMTSPYVKLAHDYLEQCNGVADRYWHDIVETGFRLAPEHELFRAAVSSPDSRQTPRAGKPVKFRRFYEHHVSQGRLAIAQENLSQRYREARASPAYQNMLQQMLADGVRRPSPLTPVSELGFSEDRGQIFLKREDRRRHHDDALINALGQTLLAQHLGKTRIVTATKDGTHGQAVAAMAARLRLECVIYIDVNDMYQHYARVLRMRQLGAQVRPVHSVAGNPLEDPRQYALEAWLQDPKSTLFVSGLTGGPHPFPTIVREIQTTVGREAVDQVKRIMGGLPACVVAGSMDSYLGMGLIQAFLEYPQVKLYWVDAPELSPDDPDSGATPVRKENQSGPPPWTVPRSVREHHWLHESGRVNYVAGDPNETLRVVEQFHTAGTTLFTASARSLAYARQLARQLDPKAMVLTMLPNQDVSDLRGFSHDW